MGGLTDTGGADDGEVEDYKISLAKSVTLFGTITTTTESRTNLHLPV
ncbi:MAG: hypothetical protein R2769_02685 [Saprospiraceae bacterium]